MQPAPPTMLRIRDTGERCLYQGFLSWNTFGAVVWSDTRCVGPMTPPDETAVRVAPSGRLFWLGDASQEESRGGIWAFFKRRPEVGWCTTLTIEDWRRAIADRIWQGAADSRAREKAVRIWHLWALNDPHRADRRSYGRAGATKQAGRARRRAEARQAAIPQPTDDDEQSILALAAMLDHAMPNDRLLAAECFRACGRFAQCIQLLEGFEPPEPHFGRILELIRECATAGDRLVVPLA
jgi:hypothetical protein